MNEPLNTDIDMKTTLTVRAIFEMLLHYRNFLAGEFTIKIEMQASSRLNAIHTLHKILLLHRFTQARHVTCSF